MTPFLNNKTLFFNNYFDPYTITFSQPLTYEMVDIIVLYHYVMMFLIFIVLFTFLFIILSLRHTVFMWKKEYENYLANPYNSLKLYRNIFLIEDLEKKENFKKWIENRRKLTHAPVLEFFWVILPTVILGFIIYPSIMLLYSNENFADPVLNISVIGNQWFWTYEYNDFHLPTMFLFYCEQELTTGTWKGMREFHRAADYVSSKYAAYLNDTQEHLKTWQTSFKSKIGLPERISFDSNMIIAKDTSKFPRLLSTDNVLVLPTKTPLRLLVTSNDVIHSWAVPSYGIKVDAIPGRINQQLLYIPLMGRAWGQCSELCGVNHGFMPIEIKSLPRPEFNQYIYLRFLDETADVRKEFFNFQLKNFVNHIDYLWTNGMFNLLEIQGTNYPAVDEQLVEDYLKQINSCLRILVRLKNPIFLAALEKAESRASNEVALIRGTISFKQYMNCSHTMTIGMEKI